MPRRNSLKSWMRLRSSQGVPERLLTLSRKKPRAQTSLRQLKQRSPEQRGLLLKRLRSRQPRSMTCMCSNSTHQSCLIPSSLLPITSTSKSSLRCMRLTRTKLKGSLESISLRTTILSTKMQLESRSKSQRRTI